MTEQAMLAIVARLQYGLQTLRLSSDPCVDAQTKLAL